MQFLVLLFRQEDHDVFHDVGFMKSNSVLSCKTDRHAVVNVDLHWALVSVCSI